MSDGSAAATACSRCASAQPQAARFCHRCGHDHRDAGTAAPGGGRAAVVRERRGQYVVRPQERVRSFNLVSALLPLSSGKGVRTYELALALAVAIPVAAASLGWVSFALVAAALAVPAVFTIYLYDVNEWEDQPVPVVLACLVASGVLGAGAIWILQRWLLDASDRVGFGDRLGFGDSGSDVRDVVVLGVVAPLLALILSLAGPLWLAARPRFDDMIDGLTFGAMSGAAYAAGETLMMHRDVFGTDSVRRGGAELWVSIIGNAAIAKPIVYGAAVAIAAAAFSGIGPGYEGFGRRYAKGLAIAVVGVVAYDTGVAVLGNLDVDQDIAAALGLGWGVVVAAVLVVVLRTQLHLGILEAALESARGRPSRHEATGEAHCGECEMFLAPLALFCSACGMSVRATSKPRQRFNVGRQLAGVDAEGASG
ncbi:MAG: hypothetical protein ACRD0G_06110 [Acidimicrobiales bacterium]